LAHQGIASSIPALRATAMPAACLACARNVFHVSSSIAGPAINDLLLQVGSDYQAKVYLNGQEVYKYTRPRG
jgi:hypothetical protein